MSIERRLQRAEARMANRCPECQLRPYTVVYGNDTAEAKPCPKCGTVPPRLRVIYEEGGGGASYWPDAPR